MSTHDGFGRIFFSEGHGEGLCQRHGARMAHTAALLALLIAWQPATAIDKQACPKLVRISALDYAVPPWFYGSGAAFQKPPGLAVEWVQKAVAQTGCDTQVQLMRRPVKRFYMELEQGATDILAIATATPERLIGSAYPMANGALDARLAYLRSGTSLWVRKGTCDVQWDGQVLRGPEGFLVGVSSGQSSESLARKQGWKLDLAANGVVAIDKLLAGRDAAILVPDITVAAASPDKQSKMERLMPSLEQTLFFSPANRTFHARYPAFMARYWEALHRIAHAGQVEQAGAAGAAGITPSPSQDRTSRCVTR